MDFWKRYIQIGGKEAFEAFKQQLICEFNALPSIEGLPRVEELKVLPGSTMNFEYRLPNGQTVKFLDDRSTYLGNRLECVFGGGRCFYIAANMGFLLVCICDANGENPELAVYQKR